VSSLERHCRWLLRVYPSWYRRQRAGEMLDTLLDATRPGARWPSFRDGRALAVGGLRVRGLTWLLSMLWTAAGAVLAGYLFYNSTQPWYQAIGIPGWSTDPLAVQITLCLAIATWLALTLPVGIAGFIRLRAWRPANWLRAAGWAVTWIGGLALAYLAIGWGQSPSGNLFVVGDSNPGTPVIVWEYLWICAAWLVLAAVMTWILAVPARRSDVPNTSSRASGKANRPAGARGLRT
jgi:hypothetical protein